MNARNKIKKGIVFFVLIAVTVVTLFRVPCVEVFADDYSPQSGVCGNNGAVTYQWDGRGILIIDGEGAMDDVADMPFQERTWSKNIDFSLVKTILIGDGITKIGEYSFENAAAETVILGKNVKTIGEGAFYECEQLESITIPDNVTTIDDNAFFGTKNMKSVVFGKKVQTIGETAFAYTGLQSLTLPSSIRTIKYHAFINNNLDEVTIPATFAQVKLENDIYGGVFSDCKIRTVVFEDGLTDIPDEFLINTGYWGVEIRYVELPESVTHIGSHALEPVAVSEWDDWEQAYVDRNPVIYYSGSKQQFLEIDKEESWMLFRFPEDDFHYAYRYDGNNVGSYQIDENLKGVCPTIIKCAKKDEEPVEPEPEDPTPPEPETPETPTPVLDADAFIAEHLEFINSGRYNKHLARRLSAYLYGVNNKSDKKALEAFYNIMKGASELSQCKTLSIFENPYDAVLVDLILSQTEAKQQDFELNIREDTEKNIQQVYDLFKNAYQTQHDLEAGTWDLDGEYKTYIEQLFLESPKDLKKSNSEFYNLLNNTLGKMFLDEKELNDFLKGFGKAGTFIKAVEDYSDIVEWVYDCMNFATTVKAFIKTSSEFKSALSLMGQYMTEKSDDVLENVHYVTSFQSALDKYLSYEGLSEEKVAELMAKEFAWKGGKKAVNLFSSTLAEHVADYVKVGLALSDQALATVLIWVKAYNTGISIGDRITGNDKIFDYQEEIRAWFYLSEAAKDVTERYRKTFVSKQTLQSAKNFDIGYTIMQRCEGEILEAYGKLLSCYTEENHPVLEFLFEKYKNNIKENKDMYQYIQQLKLEWEKAVCHGWEDEPEVQDITCGYIELLGNIEVRDENGEVLLSVKNGEVKYVASGNSVSVYPEEHTVAFAMLGREKNVIVFEAPSDCEINYSELTIREDEQTAEYAVYQFVAGRAGEAFSITKDKESGACQMVRQSDREEIISDEEETVPLISLSATSIEDLFVYSDSEIDLEDKVYTGKPQTVGIRFIDDEKDGYRLVENTDYTVAYENNTKVGRAVCIITGIGNYYDELFTYFDILPKGTAISKLAGGKKSVTVKWKKQPLQTTGYQIQYSTDAKFRQAKKVVTVKGANKTSRKIAGLKAKKKYYLRIRTYKTVNGTKYYSAWSKTKTVRRQR